MRYFFLKFTSLFPISDNGTTTYPVTHLESSLTLLNFPFPFPLFINNCIEFTVLTVFKSLQPLQSLIFAHPACMSMFTAHYT